MRTAALIALSFLLSAGGAANAEDTPFASIKDTFWRPTDSGFADGVALMVSDDTLALSSPCYFVRHVFDGDQGKPRFKFRADYWFRDNPGCELSKLSIDASDIRLREAAAFHVDSSMLKLQDADGHQIALFTRIVPDGLELRWWTITGYWRDGKIVRLMHQDGLKPQILFFNGTLLGTPGAGEFSGSYLLQNNRLNVSANRLCAGGCAGNIVNVTARQTASILEMLNRELTPKAGGADQYILDDQQGRVVLELTEEK